MKTVLMMRRLVCSLLVWVVLVGCVEDEMTQEQPEKTPLKLLMTVLFR